LLLFIAADIFMFCRSRDLARSPAAVRQLPSSSWPNWQPPEGVLLATGQQLGRRKCQWGWLGGGKAPKRPTDGRPKEWRSWKVFEA